MCSENFLKNMYVLENEKKNYGNSVVFATVSDNWHFGVAFTWKLQCHILRSRKITLVRNPLPDWLHNRSCIQNRCLCLIPRILKSKIGKQVDIIEGNSKLFALAKILAINKKSTILIQSSWYSNNIKHWWDDYFHQVS